jgi:hypothetical protein
MGLSVGLNLLMLLKHWKDFFDFQQTRIYVYMVINSRRKHG